MYPFVPCMVRHRMASRTEEFRIVRTRSNEATLLNVFPPLKLSSSSFPLRHFLLPIYSSLPAASHAVLVVRLPLFLTFTRLVMSAAVAPSVSTLSNTLISMDSKKIAKEGS